MKKSAFLLLVLISGIFQGLSGQLVIKNAKFKNLIRPDSVIIPNLNGMNIRALYETGVENKELAIAGQYNAQDSSGNFIQPFFFGYLDKFGSGNDFHSYSDSNIFVVSGAVAYDMTRDENHNYYFAAGSNNFQMIISTDSSGNLRWHTALNHHEFYSIKYLGNGQLIALGQDESTNGAHDYSAVLINSQGLVTKANMSGLANFEQPETVVPFNGDFFLSGSTFENQQFQIYLVMLDSELDPKWGKLFINTDRNWNVKDACLSHDGNFLVTGSSSKNQTRSLSFLMKINPQGNVLWTKTYSHPALDVEAAAISCEPDTGTVIISGSIRKNNYLQPFAMRTDSSGNFLWARDYGTNDTVTEELFEDVIILKNDTGWFAASGRHTKIDQGGKTSYRGLLVKARLSDGETSCDTAINLTVGTEFFNDSLLIMNEPLLKNDNYPFSQQQMISHASVVCSVMVQKTIIISREHLLSEDFWIKNPVQNKTLSGGFERPPDHALSFFLLDLQGREVARGTIESGSLRFEHELHELSTGMYIFRLRRQGNIQGIHRKLFIR